jgi:hypothetical protein
MGPIRLPSVFIHHSQYQKLKRSDTSSALIAAAAAQGTISLKEADLITQVCLYDYDYYYCRLFPVISLIYIYYNRCDHQNSSI